ncbi:MAG TPA: L-threonylcarbamoyladenylate synthase [Capsulimonadaceae bacterium]|nr:L-threonylcarbamoyladenylate synthase [Capsulimonadaceae bacterium]
MGRILQASDDAILEAAAAIRAGDLVAFPTETVYGLGANALNGRAVLRIFEAKGRPADNPVIVHVADPDGLEAVAHNAPAAAPLVRRFWPGPLTVILPKKPIIPDVVTAGGSTVGVRMPSHPVALSLIRAAGVPIAAPSANRSEQISPTQAAHVLQSLGDSIDIILDGGHTKVGVESTVIDLTEEPPRLLRPGMVLPAEIEEILGRPLARIEKESGLRRSPGQMPRHYAPGTPLVILKNLRVDLPGVSLYPIGLLAFGSDERVPLGVDIAQTIIMPADPAAYAASLYDALYALDEASLALILVEAVPDGDEWLAIRDRLARAASSVGGSQNGV